jgi:hypothetical protein
MARRRRTAHSAEINWKTDVVEAVFAGMRAYWLGSGDVNIDSVEARMMGAQQSFAPVYSNSKYFKLGEEVGSLTRQLAQRGNLLPGAEGELGRLILAEEGGFFDTATESADSMLESLTEMFGG